MAQTMDQRWSFGITGGVNLWLNDLKTRKPGVGLSLAADYALSTPLSVGVTAGLEELKSANDEPSSESPYSYMKLFSIPLSVRLRYHLAPSRTVSPYITLGGGMMMYQRRIIGLSETGWKSTFVLPAGLGVKWSSSPAMSFTAEAGYAIVGEGIDLVEKGPTDGYVYARLGLHWSPGPPPVEDGDLDGLSDEQERRLGTDPQNPDTDGDKLSDGDEVKKYHTNPLRADSDGDGLTDGEEVLRYQTDPTQSDTDHDGLSDGDEITRDLTDPLRADTDGDGLSDGEELTSFHTDPLKIDSDGDGLADNEEVRTYHTDPCNPDTDGDGIVDGDETLKYKTGPTKADTDNGGMIDGAEIIRGTDPLNPRDDMAVDRLRLSRGSRVVLQRVEFEPTSAQLTNGAEETLRRVCNALKASPDLRLEIAGYTDNVGSGSSNQLLSEQRAETVRQWLMANGIGAERLVARGYGSSHPIDSNATANGRARNRRIEIHVR
jgi:outer membrane protein OmpA-like peptidoglycan-associated protein